MEIYKQGTGIEIGKLQPLSSFEVTNPMVAKKLKERYGDHLPLEEQIISPGSMYVSDKLITVMEN